MCFYIELKGNKNRACVCVWLFNTKLLARHGFFGRAGTRKGNPIYIDCIKVLGSLLRHYLDGDDDNVLCTIHKDVG